MGHGIYAVYSGTIASNATASSELDLGRAWNRVYIDPTNLGAEVRFLAAPLSGGTYRQVYMPQAGSTSTVQSNLWKVATAVSGGIQEAPPGLRYIKVVVTATAANGASFTVYCSD